LCLKHRQLQMWLRFIIHLTVFYERCISFNFN
jgi:hypothetical protein